jgi:pimeloyl-ACP methyl ester carboxylesterase
VPALVLVGEYDRVTPPAGAVALAAALPEGRLDVIAGAGHIPMLEAPDVVVRELRGFARAVLAPAAERPRSRRRTPARPKGGREARG